MFSCSRRFLTAFLVTIILFFAGSLTATNEKAVAQSKRKELSVQKTELELISINEAPDGPVLPRIPKFKTTLNGRYAAQTTNGNYVFFTLEPTLQKVISSIVEKSRSKHVAVVLAEPSTGKILAMNGRSPTIINTLLHNGFPAASLFKVITSAAALEKSAIRPDSLIKFRGGNYTLNLNNYKPSFRQDKRYMSVEEALGKSVNPVFGRIALQFLNSAVLRQYVRSFGFNAPFYSDLIVPTSYANIPDSEYELSRTGAGFGDVSLSPLHAVSMISAIANEGRMEKLSLIDKIVSPTGVTTYRSGSSAGRVVVKPQTAKTLLDMMESTVTRGTSRKDFMHRSISMRNVHVSGKTGSLTGDNPKGFTNLFIGTAPSNRPEVAVAVVVVDDKSLRSRASTLARQALEGYFSLR